MQRCMYDAGEFSTVAACSEFHCVSQCSCLVLLRAQRQEAGGILRQERVKRIPIYCGKGVRIVDILDVHLFSVRAARPFARSESKREIILLISLSPHQP
eukprot:scaffold296778_cov66-Cyclotella_meneghiniana.AAC.2